MSHPRELIGKTFGRLTVISRANNNSHGQTNWNVKCDCGIEKIVLGINLIKGTTKSCGCLNVEKRKELLYTDDFLQKEALKYETKKEFEIRNPKVFYAAAKRKVLNKICKHMKVLRKFKYTDKELEQEALKYSSRKDFERGNGGAYSSAGKRGILDLICKHMKPMGNHYKRALYAFEHPDNSAYIGLTYNYDLRYKDHMKQTQLLIDKNKAGGQVFKEFNVWYTYDTVGQKEAELIEEYRKNGWIILNKNKAGSLGAVTPHKRK